MSKLTRLINKGDYFGVEDYLLRRLKNGNIFKFQIKNALKKIERSSISNKIFLPYIDCDELVYDKRHWDKQYLSNVINISLRSSKFDREFVLHMSDVSNHVYLGKHIAIGAGITLGAICVAAAVVCAVK